MRRRRPTDLRSYRSGLYRDGELLVGAYARAQRRRQILIALAGLALIGGAVWLYLALHTPTEAVGTGVPLVQVQCIVPGCAQRTTLRLSGKEVFPVRCPKCGQNSCQPLWECRDCGEQFLARGRQAELVCPRCRSRRVGISEVVRQPPGSE